ncbi:MAG: hypothetical protein ABSD88_20640 [Candidatus Korobacteraceae bacterium]|jgi:hypothetical protein
MEAVQLKLKQASAVLGVAPKDLQNLVQLGVVRPRRRADVFWFDANILLQAKIALYVKASLRPSMDYLARLTKEVSRVNLVTTPWDALLLASSPGRGRPPVEIKVPLRELKKEIEESLPLAEVYKDLPRGRKRRGWKEEFVSTLQQLWQDIGELSEQEIAKRVRIYRSEKKKQPEIRLVAQDKKSA